MKFFTTILFLLIFSTVFSQNVFVKDSVLAYQQHLNSEYKDPEKSPLLKKDLKKFKGLNFFAANEKYFVMAKFVRTPNEKPFEMPTTTTRKPIYVKYGEAHFELDGKKVKLDVFQSLDYKKINPKALFLPFTDLTSGVESYGGGRYLDLEIPENEVIVIDFNKAYNPYCAYNHTYSCPIPPAQNDVPVEINAGVKKFKK
ncbi:DUF1684 domain-containing protein [Flavobacterium ichthyis]|nr:DUF1684 domain-containing protein [Flavobacterium ichthyis]